jgi:hypothetical protein
LSFSTAIESGKIYPTDCVWQTLRIPNMFILRIAGLEQLTDIIHLMMDSRQAEQ